MDILLKKRGLVFEGGGTTGIAHLGVLQKLHEWNVLDNFTHFAGSSVGSIVACALGCGASIDFIEKSLKTVDFNKLEDDSCGVVRDMYRLIKNYGFCKGDALEKWFGNILNELTGSCDITFKMAYEKYGKYVCITGTDTRKSGMHTVYMDYISKPNMMIRKAVRISYGIPLFYKAVFEESCDGIEHIFTDGGILDNLPFGVLDKHLDIDQVIGISLNKTKQNAEKIDKESIKNIFEYIKITIDGLRSQAMKVHVKKMDWARTIKIDTLNYSATDFDITDNDKIILIIQGQKAAQLFLESL